MKKLTATALALLLTLSLTFASAQTYTAGTYYTIDYADSLTLDDTSYTGDSTADTVWLFMLSNDSYVIDANMETLTDYAGFSLYSATADERQAYLDDTLTIYADEGIQYIDTLTVAGNIPFYLYRMDSSDGAYYYAETIANGTSVYFVCYYTDDTTPDDALLQNFETLLKTFVPVGTQSTAPTASSTTSNATTGDGIDAIAAATIQN